MRVDAHQHFWSYDPVRDAWIADEMRVLKRDFLPKDLAPELSKTGIDATIAVQADQSENETRFLLGLAEADSKIAGVVGWVDLRAANIEQRLEHFSHSKKLRGFRHVAQSEPDDRFLVRDDLCRGISNLAGYGFTYDVLIYPKQLEAAAELVEKLPQQRFVIDHMAKPLIKSGVMEPWAALMRRIARSGNVFCKVSGLITEADWARWKPADLRPYLDVVFEAFGTTRLMFGSDWPVCLVAGTYQQVVDLVANYASSDHEKIFGLNAAAFYGLRA